MANGKLGANALTAATNTTVYTVPVDHFSVVSVNFTNRNSQARNIRIALADADSPTTAEWVEYDTELIGNGVLERTGFVLSAGQKIVCFSNSTDCNAVVYGIETSTAQKENNMPRRISTSIQGGPVLGTFTAQNNILQTIEPNDDIIFDPNGTGDVRSNAHVSLQSNSQLRLADSDSSNYVALAVPGTVASNITYTLPSSGVTDGYFLKTNGSGTLSWAAANVSVSNNTTSGTTYYPTLITSTSGIITAVTTSNSKFSFTPSNGTISATRFSGNLLSSSVDINGGAIDGTTVGSSNASSGRFSSITETSSITYKENVRPIEGALNSIKRLVGVTYDRLDGSATAEPGLIAEEVAKILPNVVKYNDDETADGITYTKLTAYLIEAVKELTAEVETLKGRN